MKKITFAAFLWLLLAAMGCKTGGTVVGGELKKRPAKFLLQQLDKNALQYEWFVAKAKANFKGNDQNLAFVADMHLQKDSIIWMAVKKIGIEGMRVRITPQRIELLNHLEKKYTSRPYDFLSKQFNIGLSFADLQNLLVGNPLALNEAQVVVDTQAGRYVLQQSFDQTNVQVHLNAQSFVLEKLVGKAFGNVLVATLSDYQAIEGQTQQIAFQKNLDVNNGAMQLDITFNKVEVNSPAKTTFNVPEHYERDVQE